MLNNNNFNGNNFNHHNIKFSVIAAFDKKRGIGKNNSIPWNITGDLKYFKEITTKTEDPEKENAIIMGRKTWDSLPIKPLSGRKNIVISSSLDIPDTPNLFFVEDPQKSIVLSWGITEKEEIFVIGGKTIYEWFINFNVTSKIYLNKIDFETEYDKEDEIVFFPEITKPWMKRKEIQKEKFISIEFEKY
jgi:dihydrofolate reductase